VGFKFAGPLRVSQANPRYLTDESGRALYLTGSHNWVNLQDGGANRFDYDAFLDFLHQHNHNFFRLWAWESSTWVLPDSRQITLDPLPFARTGPGLGRDGKPRFDLTRFNSAYFDRLRQRVIAAGDRGLYVGVMLFQGFSVSRKHASRRFSPWMGHPFHRENNVNGIDGDADGDGEGYEVHTLASRELTRIQETYVRQAIDTVNDLDNVIYEISNESHGGSTAWQVHMIDLIHRYETEKPKQHPVWMSYQWDGLSGAGTNADLFGSPAEVISPNHEGGYQDDPPANDGSKVILNDTDHLWGVGGDAAWVWKSFLRGLNPVFMDPYRDIRAGCTFDPRWDPARRAMGDTLRYANRVNLVEMIPAGELASSGYCLARPGIEYLVYVPEGIKATTVTVDLAGAEGELVAEWFDVSAGQVAGSVTVRGDARRAFTATFKGEAVLYVHKPPTKRD
jgi:hypothetical protein